MPRGSPSPSSPGYSHAQSASSPRRSAALPSPQRASWVESAKMDRENARKARERMLRRQELALQKKSFALGNAPTEDRHAAEAALYNALIDDGDGSDRFAFHAVPSTVSAISGAYGLPHERQPSARHRYEAPGYMDDYAAEIM